MGLDITAYSKMTRIDDIDDVEEWEEKYYDWDTETDTCLVHGGTLEFTEGSWPGRTKGLERGTYRVDGERLSFRAGSYGGYNWWREVLSVTMLNRTPNEIWNNPDSYGLPFVELIDFSDCEGYIGPKTAQKLARDFQANQGKANAYEGEEARWFKAQYANWRRAFELAADDGLVDFH